MAGDANGGDEKPELIVKKIKPPGPAPHGGAWKVAYADFVTAMMAFFLLLWLLSSATEQQLQGISNYFKPIGARTGSSGGEGLFGGVSGNEAGPIPEHLQAPQVALTSDATVGSEQVEEAVQRQDLTEDLPNLTNVKRENESKQFKAAEAAIQQALDQVPELRDLHEGVKIEITDEGLEIQLIDQDRVSMFKAGGAELHEHTRQLLLLISSVVERLPNRISLSGHTDSTPFRSPSGKSNWDLSIDRANAGRREMQRNGIPIGRFQKVAGMADKDPLFPDDPASPGNRRLVVTLLRDPDDPKIRLPEPPRIFGVQ
ncbi:MAG: flagellar motor protein MotB [Alphaproteobacteria bacterium]